MKVLWLSRETPLPATSGDRNYTRSLVRALAASGAQIDFISLWSEERNIDIYRRDSPAIKWLPVEGGPKSSLIALWSLLPLATSRHHTYNFRKALNDVLKKSQYQAIVLDHYAIGWVLRQIKSNNLSHDTVLVHICHDFTTKVSLDIADRYKDNIFKKIFLRWNSWKIAKMEQKIANEVDIITVITEEDGDSYGGLSPKRRPLVLRPGFDGYSKKSRVIDIDTPRRVIILGSFNWIAKQMNLEEFLAVADEIFSRHNIKLDIIGMVPSDFKERWKQKSKATSFLGFVDNIDKEFEQARFGLVIEATGGGFKLKLLDYIFGRVPVASFSSALSGMEPKILDGFIIRDDAQSLVEAVCQSIDDLDLLNRLQNTAFDAAVGRYNSEENGTNLYDAIKDASSGR